MFDHAHTASLDSQDDGSTSLLSYDKSLSAAGGLVAKLYLTLLTPWTVASPGSSVHGILQVRFLEWLPFPSPGGLPDPGIKPGSPALQADSLPTEESPQISLPL